MWDIRESARSCSHMTPSIHALPSFLSLRPAYRPSSLYPFSLGLWCTLSCSMGCIYYYQPGSPVSLDRQDSILPPLPSPFARTYLVPISAILILVSSASSPSFPPPLCSLAAARLSLRAYSEVISLIQILYPILQLYHTASSRVLPHSTATKLRIRLEAYLPP